MQPAQFRQEDILLVKINNAKSTSPAVSSGGGAKTSMSHYGLKLKLKGEDNKNTCTNKMNTTWSWFLE